VVLIACLGAFCAPVATAAEFTTTGTPPVSMIGEQEETHVLTLESAIKCKKASFEGTVTKTAQKTIELAPKYSECTMFGVAATLTSGGCKYKFLEPTGAGPFTGLVSLLCPAGESVKVTLSVPECEVRLTEQTSKGTLTYENLGGSPATVRVKPSLEKLKYNKTKDGPSCPLSGTGEKEDGKYTGNTRLEGRKEITQVPIAVGEVPVSFKKSEGYGLGNEAQSYVEPCFVGDPVNCATGNLVEEQADLFLRGRGPGLAVNRYYNSQIAVEAAAAGPYGYGWSGPYSAHLELNAAAETATVTHDNGSSVTFYTYEGKYLPASWAQSSLVKEGENYVYTLPDQERLKFNSSGVLTECSDRNGNAIALSYLEGKLKTAKDSAGRELTFAYTGAQVTSIEDPMGHKVKYTYEASNLATVTLPGEESAHWKFEYDAAHQMTKMTDGRGHSTLNEYDTSRRVKTQTDRLERKRKFEYGETLGVKETTITEPNGSTTLEKFNAAGEPVETIRAKGTALAQTSSNEFNKAFALTKSTDPASHATTYEYDAEGNRKLEKDAEGDELKWTYNSTRDVKTITTPRNETTTINRDGKGNVESVERPAPGATTQKTTFKHAANGDLESTTDPLTHTTEFEYDTYGNRKTAIDAEGDKRTWTYDKDGRAITEVSPRGNEAGAEPSKFETKTERDSQGRPLKITDPLGHTTEFKYDANGNLESKTDGLNHTTKYTYDFADQRTKVEAANETATETAYDSEGQIKSRTDGNGRTTKYERNALGQLTETIDPLERKTTREYSAAGNLEKIKDPEGRTTTFSYDKADRLTKIDFSEEATADVTYEYDKDGNVTVMKDGTGTTENTYDQLGRLTEAKNGNAEVVKFEYNLGNLQTKITYPNGKAITREYDKADRLSKVTDWLSKATTFAYNRDSQPKLTTFPTTAVDKDTWEYNNAGELAKVTMTKGEETLASLTYTRDKAGQAESLAVKGLPGKETTGYTYDKANRLTKGGEASFEYDNAGNPTKIGTTAYSYDKASQLEKGGTTTYGFDKLGERTKASPEGGSATTYGYDQAHNLVSIARTTPKIENTYAYDGKGLRVSEKISGATNRLAWDTAEPLPLLLYDGTRYYLYGPDGAPFEQIVSEAPTYLHHDGQGSTRLLTDSAGTTQGTYTYTPYGSTEGHTGTATTPLGYDGQYTSADTGLIYLRARVYDPQTAQFMSVDPAVADTGEPYGYAGQNPVNADDPSGRLPQPPPMPYADSSWDPMQINGEWVWNRVYNGELYRFGQGGIWRRRSDGSWDPKPPNPPPNPPPPRPGAHPDELPVVIAIPSPAPRFVPPPIRLPVPTWSPPAFTPEMIGMPGFVPPGTFDAYQSPIQPQPTFPLQISPIWPNAREGIRGGVRFEGPLPFFGPYGWGKK
jgi:RHS repeat-associated protein